MKRLLPLWIVLPILVACAGSPPSPAPTLPLPTATLPPAPTPAEESNPAVDLARAQLRDWLGLSNANLISLASLETVDWPDACLGVGVPGRMCAEVITPGYKMVFSVNGVSFEVHTDLAGENVQPADPPETGFQAPPPAVDSIAESLRAMLAAQLRLGQPDAVRLAAWQERTWDGCLGVARPDQACPMIAISGYRLVLGVGDALYEYHTNQDGSRVRLAAAPPVNLDVTPALEWSRTDSQIGTCESIALYPDGRAAFGECGLPQIVSRYESTRLSHLSAEFAPFEADTPAGHVVLRGSGRARASEAEQRSVAEGARLAGMELQSGRTGASWGLAIAWHREGGIAGVCQELTIYMSGEFYATDCRSAKDVAHGWLEADSLGQLYGWADRFQSVEYESAPPAGSADMFIDRYVFSGNGAAVPSIAEQEAIDEWLGQLHAKVSTGG